MSLLTIISWNMQHKETNWNTLESLGVDAALLQEAKIPSPPLYKNIAMDIDDFHSKKMLSWSTAALALSDRIEFEPIQTQPIGTDNRDAIMVSRPGTFAAANIRILETGELLTIVSLYATWANPINQIGSDLIYADASVHRLISDLSALIGRKKDHKIIVSGDLNILYGYGENGNLYWKERYDTIFNRMTALGLKFIGPQAPEGGLQAMPWPSEMPADSHNVPTYRTNKEKPETATRQLDYVFASESIANRLSVRAANNPEKWGPSDHCRIFIDLEK